MHLVLFGFIGLALVCASAEFLRRARWIDRLALIAALVLAVCTITTLDGDLVSMGAFGGVFAFGP